MDYVQKQDLRGYRVPTDYEHSIVINCILPYVKWSIKCCTFWFLFLFLIALGAFMDIPNKFADHNFKYVILELIILICTGLGAIKLYSHISYSNRVAAYINTVNYLVLKCKLYDVYLGPIDSTESSVKICTEYDEYCTDNFRTRTKDALEWQNGNKDKLFLLFRCIDKQDSKRDGFIDISIYTYSEGGERVNKRKK